MVDPISLDRLAEIDNEACDRLALEEKGNRERWRPDLNAYELRALVGEIYDLRDDNHKLERSVKVLESFRPHWAKGFTDDSMAAQTYLAATLGMWEALGVDNQTEAMQAIRDLLALAETADLGQSPR